MGVAPPNPQELADRAAITDVLHRYCRAMDRMDRDLALSCWHPGGTDDHAPNYVGPAEGLLDWLWPFHAGFTSTRHVTGNILIALNGDEAGVESYCDVTLRFRRGGETYDLYTSGRYLDRFERRDGVWAIRHRQAIGEWSRIDKATLTVADFSDPPLVAPAPGGGERAVPARDRSDLSYTLLP